MTGKEHLIGKTVRWDGGDARPGMWFTMRVNGRSQQGVFHEEWAWHGEVLDPGTARDHLGRQDYEVGDTAYVGDASSLTVIDPEPITDDPECE